MALITLYNTDKGIGRLMTAMFDLDVYGAWARKVPTLSEASEDFREMFENYRLLLKAAYDEAAPWWEKTIKAQVGLGLSQEDAIRTSFENRLAGAASDPKVVWVVRSLWLKCAEMNMSVPDSAKVRPEVFLLQWLIDAGETELVRLIACMPYWPIGLDENGNWC